MSDSVRRHSLRSLACSFLVSIVIVGNAFAAVDVSVVHGISGGDVLSINGSDLDSINGSDVLSINGSDLDSINGSDVLSINGSDLDSINGSDVLSINGSDLDSINGSDVLSINGSDLDSINGSDILSINGSDLDSINGSDVLSINGSDLDSINGGDSIPGRSAAADLLVRGTVEYIDGDFVSVLGQSVIGSDFQDAGIAAGTKIEVYGRIDNDTGSFVDTAVVAVEADSSDYLRGTVDEVDASRGVAVISGVSVDYSALLSNGQAPEVGDEYAVSGRNYGALGLMVAEAGE